MNTEIIKISASDPDFESKMESASEIIKSGGLVVFPTETVYGLGADATNPDAAKKIFSAKGRPSDNPLIIHVADSGDAEKYAYTNSVYDKLAASFMPGPLTVILKSRDIIPTETRGGLSTVAVRCPENSIARSLIRKSGVPIAAPSANLSGSPSPTEARHVIDDLYGRVDMIIDGGSSDFGLESTIVKIEDDGHAVLLRPGKITAEQLAKVVGFVEISDAVTNKLRDGEVALSPGMKYRHYAPKAPVLLLDSTIEKTVDYIEEYTENAGFSHFAVVAYEEDVCTLKNKFPKAHIYPFGARGDEIKQAGLLFSILRDADKESFDIIFAPLPKKKGVGLALYNRMIRAAAYKTVKL